ncbi:ABC transporter ATP-binding protein [Cryomorphaceae bacterium 1068]|nr:ABC transporter ATP-binding protein [Cryomorphaceae bacterium 1068]
MIQTEKISVGYGAKILVKELDLLLPKGSVTAFIGSNGSGKSSLMRVLNGLQEPLSGKVSWDGRNLSDFDRKEKAKVAASLYSNFARVEGFTVAELVALGRSNFTGFFGKLSAQDHDKIDEVIETVGITSLKEKELTTLSDGEFRKAMLAKLLAQDTDILFLDEPTTHLDLPAALDFVQVLKNLAIQGKTIVMSTHHLALAFKMADHILLFDGNGKAAFGNAERMMNHELLCGFLKTDKIRVENGNLLFDI